jgi:2-alkenal reductase
VAEGLGFAIPVNTAQAVANQIIQYGFISRPYMGVDFQPITPDIANAYNLPVQWGAYVTSIAANSPASQAVLQTGDIITSIGGVALDETHSFINSLFTYKPGDQVTVQFMRDGKSQQVQMTLGETTHG